MSIFSERVRERLDALGLSISAASERAGMSRSALGSTILGDRNPRMDTVIKLSRVLECDVAYLTGDQDEPRLPGYVPTQPQHAVAPALSSRSTARPHAADRGAIRKIPLRGVVQAGLWVERFDTFDDDLDHVVLYDGNFGPATQMAFRVAGDSMNKAGIFDGDIISAVDWIDFGAKFRDGQIVVVERTSDNGQTAEWTVKRMRVFRDHVELCPESTNPTHKQISVPFVDNGLSTDADGNQVSVIALVTGAHRLFR